MKPNDKLSTYLNVHSVLACSHGPESFNGVHSQAQAPQAHPYTLDSLQPWKRSTGVEQGDSHVAHVPYLTDE